MEDAEPEFGEVEEEGRERSADGTADGTSADGAAAASSSGGGPESEHCPGWARQGLCDVGDHVDYMKKNCARSCEAAARGEGQTVADPITCARWAMSGLCDPSSAHVGFMNQHCAEECALERARDPNAGIPPPVDILTVLIVIGFGWVTIKAVRRTMEDDSTYSLQVCESHACLSPRPHNSR